MYLSQKSKIVLTLLYGALFVGFAGAQSNHNADSPANILWQFDTGG